MSDPDIYTIGWICAIGTELVAAASFLDEEHGDLENLPMNDNNSYILGRIGKHNVVIAAPGGQHGLVPAAHIGRDMVRTFPNIRARLMVGIGGGAPSLKHDIRLGDVVVSTPGDGSGGVYQYDYGRTVQDSMFAATGHQNQPPQFMSTVVNLLKARYEQRGHDIEKAIENVLASNKRLQKFRKPDPSRDRLYKSAYTHVGTKDQECLGLCGDSQLARSPDPLEERDNPTIHYGIIASANQLMRDANLRDRISRENEVLCFEMEAAGLMNDFPCLVIRGICDYSDTHKNKIWQGYAAMAAAAYAKDLLLRLTPNQVQAGMTDPSLAKVKRKYLPLLYFDNMNERQLELEYKLEQDSMPGTYEWLFETKEFKAWSSRDPGLLTTHQQILLLEGKPGSGKSTLMTAAFNRLKHMDESCRSIRVAFFFDGRSAGLTRSSLGFYRSVLWQLLQQINTFRGMSEVIKNWTTSDTTPWGSSTLKDSISKIVRQLDDRNLHIFVDAPDECRDGENADCVIDFLIWLQKVHAKTWLCFATTDRNRFGGRLSTSTTIQVDRGNEGGIRTYINAKLPQALPHIFRTRLLDIISNRSSNMFLWVKYVVDEVNNSVASGYSEVKLEQHIRTLRTDLKEYYLRKFDELGNDTREPDNTRSLIDLMQVSMRTLTLEETMSALSHAPDARGLSSGGFTKSSTFDAAKRVQSLCRGLIEVRVRPKPVPRSSKPSIASTRTNTPPSKRRKLMPATCPTQSQGETEQIVQFVHHSVKEFLDDINSGSAGIDWLKSSTAQCHRQVAQICMRTLANSDDSPKAFLPYATQFWTLHARKGDSAIDHDFNAPEFIYMCDARTARLIEEFQRAVISARYIDVDDWPISVRLEGESSLLTLLAFEGCTKLISQHAKLCLRQSTCGTSTDVLEAALFLAASRGWTDSVYAILGIARERSLPINMDKIHQSGMTPLNAACFRGKIRTVKSLIKEGANILAPSNETAPNTLSFHTAAAQGYREIVAHFLEVVQGHETMRRNLLTSKDNYGCTVFHCIAMYGSLEVLKTLNFHIPGFEDIVHAKNRAGQTAQQIARNDEIAAELRDIARQGK